MVRVVINSESVNSRTMVDGLSPFCSCTNLLPSIVQTDFTLRPSKVSSSNSSPNLNEMVEVLKVEEVVNVYTSPSFFNSTVGDTELPILRSTMPTPNSFMYSSKFSLLSNLYFFPSQQAILEIIIFFI